MATDGRDLNARLADEVGPLLEEIDARITLEDYARRVITAALIKALISGSRAGVTEAVAQSVEQGSDVELILKVHNPSIDELLYSES